MAQGEHTAGAGGGDTGGSKPPTGVVVGDVEDNQKPPLGGYRSPPAPLGLGEVGASF